jgi:hypothetical protein
MPTAQSWPRRSEMDASAHHTARGCPPCGRSSSEISLVSAHRTSEGVLEYRRCRCGTISMVRDGQVVGRVHIGR